MSIVDVVERARREQPIPSRDGLFPDQRYICEVRAPVAWDKDDIERRLGVELPDELAALWNACGGVTLYEDDKFHQWGLVVLGPLDVDLFALNREHLEDVRGCAISGDLIIGRFWGDRERPLLRCDKSSSDYGSVTIVADIGPRSDWDSAAASLEEFLVRFMDAHGEKYWEYHYKKRLADHTVEDMLRSRRVN